MYTIVFDHRHSSFRIQSMTTSKAVRETRTVAPTELNDQRRKITSFFGSRVWVIAWLFFLPSLAADEPSTQEIEQPSEPTVEVDSFQGPRLLAPVVKPVYPHGRLIAGEESWVELNFMVDSEGKPYEIVATDSIGDSAFKSAAIRAVRKWRYRPASYNGKNIDAGARYKVIFQIEDQPKAVTRKFARIQSELRKAITGDDKDKADEYMRMLDRERKLTLYEDAAFNLSKYEYLSKWGSEQEQLEALDRAIANERVAKFLPTEAFVFALGRQLPLLLKKRDYQRAYRTYQKLIRQDLDEEAKSWLAGVAEALDELKNNQQSYDVAATIPDSSSWSIELFKDEFWLEDIEGRVVELKLRCFGDLRIIRFEPGIKYKVEKPYGFCNLEVLGDKESTFKLFQS